MALPPASLINNTGQELDFPIADPCRPLLSPKSFNKILECTQVISIYILTLLQIKR